MSARQLPVACDRRILKAFYTQYVAVLLILLVFTVGAFQRSLPSALVARTSERHEREPAPFGSLTLIGEGAGPQAHDSLDSQLDAVATILKEHDIRAVVSVRFREADSGNEQGSAIGEAVERLTLLEEIFREKQVASESLRLRIVGVGSRDDATTVDFEEAGDVR
jgi:hypothetical protein